MQVKEIMVRDTRFCRPDTNLAEAGLIMWENDCGALPVVEGSGKVVGMITDRDICIAVGTRNRAPSEVTVFDVKPNPQELYSCAPEDDIHAALQTMRTQGVRRLPVVNSGQLRGVLCLDEIALGASKRGELSYEDVVDTLRAVCEHRIARQVVAEESPEEVPVLVH
jgi:CBS domain-containing protein